MAAGTKVSLLRSSEAAEIHFWQCHGPKIVVALILTLASGFVDIIGYLGIYRLFTAHVTGTTVHLGNSIAGRNLASVASAASIIAAFFLGSIVGRLFIEIGARKRIRSIASLTLAMEGALLVTVAEILSAAIRAAPAGKPALAHPYWSLAALAAAMGMQTATLTRIGPLTVHTTFVTGMVNKLAQLVSRICFRTYDLLRRHAGSARLRLARKQESQESLFLFVIWLFYVAGAVLGTWSYDSWGVHALFVPAALLLLAIVADQIWPLSIQEEKERYET